MHTASSLISREAYGTQKDDYSLSSLMNSSISPGWQSSAVHIALSVEKRIAFTLPDFKRERFASVMPMSLASSLERILRLANTTSNRTIIGMGYTVSSCSSAIFCAAAITCVSGNKIKPVRKGIIISVVSDTARICSPEGFSVVRASGMAML